MPLIQQLTWIACSMAGGVTFVNLALLAIRSLETDNAVRKAKSPGAKQGSLTLSNARRAIQYQVILISDRVA